MWDSTRLCATPAGMLVHDVGSKQPAEDLHHRTAASNCATPRTAWRFRLASASDPPCTKLLQPRGQALGAGLDDATGRLTANLAGASGCEMPRRGIFDAPSLARTRERAKPQSLNEDSPRDERFSQFLLLVHVAAPFLASLRELVRSGKAAQPLSAAYSPSLLQTHLRCSVQACPEEQLFASQACVHPRAGCDFRSTETDRGVNPPRATD